MELVMVPVVVFVCLSSRFSCKVTATTEWLRIPWIWWVARLRLLFTAKDTSNWELANFERIGEIFECREGFRVSYDRYGIFSCWIRFWAWILGWKDERVQYVSCALSGVSWLTDCDDSEMPQCDVPGVELLPRAIVRRWRAVGFPSVLGSLPCLGILWGSIPWWVYGCSGGFQQLCCRETIPARGVQRSS